MRQSSDQCPSLEPVKTSSVRSSAVVGAAAGAAARLGVGVEKTVGSEGLREENGGSR